MTDSDRAPSSRAARPPLPRWLAYRLFNVRVPYRYRFWVRDDVLGRWYLTRAFVSSMSLVILYQGVLYFGIPAIEFVRSGEYAYWGPGPGFLLLYAGMVAVVALLNLAFPRLGRWLGRQILHKHDFHKDGTPITYVPNPPPGYPQPGYQQAGHPPQGYPQAGHPPQGRPPSSTGWHPPY